MCRSCHCNHFRTGDQWNLVPYFYYPQNETPVAQERKQDNKRGCSKGTSGNGNATGLQFSITAIGSMVMQSANNGLGSTYVSAFTAAMKIKQFTMCPFDAIATSASVFCSQKSLEQDSLTGLRKGLRCGITVGSRIWYCGRNFY